MPRREQLGRFSRNGQAPTRSAGSRGSVSDVITIAYDGARTEDDYFRNWQRVLGGAGIALRPVYVKGGGNVLVALEEAIRVHKQDGDLWCVFDVDDCPKGDVTAAIQLAKSKGVRLCLSARSFEVWLALHFAKSDKPITTEAEAINLVAGHCQGYSVKNKVVPFGELLPRSSAACVNAAWLRKQAVSNPATDVDELVTVLMGLLNA